MVGKFAGNALKWLFTDRATGQLMKTPDILFRTAPDAVFGVLEAAQTPGNVGDKLAAGASAAIGGSTGGLLLGKLAPGRTGDMLDMMGSIGGDMAGRQVGEAYQRVQDKVLGGKGQTAWERMSDQDRKALEAAVRTQTLAELGLLPASYQSNMLVG